MQDYVRLEIKKIFYILFFMYYFYFYHLFKNDVLFKRYFLTISHKKKFKEKKFENLVATIRFIYSNPFEVH